MVNKLREGGRFGWWEEYDVLRRKYELIVSTGLSSWKEKIKMRNKKDWEEEVSSKGTLKQYKLAKNGAGVEVFKVCAGSRSCEASVQTEDCHSLVVGG